MGSTSPLFEAVFVAAICMFSFEVTAQKKMACSECVIEARRFPKGKIKKSKSPIEFKVQGLKGELKFSNMGKPLTVEMSFTFKDSTAAYEIGDLLIINFEDGSRQEVIQSSRKTYAGTAYFILIQPTGSPAAMEHEDKLFYEKLKKLDIISYRLTVSGTLRDLIVPSEKSKLIKRTVECLMEGN